MCGSTRSLITSGISFLDEPATFNKFWPSATHIVGKDILRFHAVIWPAMLKSVGIAPPRRIFAHGFWTINGRKFSKSLGDVINPDYLIGRYGLDPLRYYMFRAFPFGADGDFSEINLVERNNSELAKGLGNLLQRTTSMISKYCHGVIPGLGSPDEMDDELPRAAASFVSEICLAFDDLAFSKVLDAIWEFIRRLNIYLNARKPWELAGSDDQALLEKTLAHAAEGLRFLTTSVTPFMPGSGKEMAARLGFDEVPKTASLVWGGTLAGAQVREGEPLFRMLELPEPSSAEF